MRQLLPRSIKTLPLALTPIAAGPAAEIGEDYALLDINELITHGREGFAAYEVTGDSRAPEIMPGNIVFVNTLAEPRPRQLIAARVNGLVCIKEFQISRRRLYLVSSDSAKHPPREVHETDDFQVLGVYVGHLALASLRRCL